MVLQALKAAGHFAEIHQGIISALLTIFGWFAVFWFGLRQQKKQLRNEAKMKVYEELYNLKKEVNETSIPLGLLFITTPFLQMEWTKKEPGAIQANLKALDLWRKYTLDMSEKTYNFTEAYRKLWSHAEMWMSIMPQLKKAKDELFVIQLKHLSEKLYQHQNFLLDLSVKEFYWEKWDKDSILKKNDELSQEFNDIAAGYLDDFIGLVHNRLIAPIFGHKRLPREYFNPKGTVKCKVLTEDGVEEQEVNYTKH